MTRRLLKKYMYAGGALAILVVVVSLVGYTIQRANQPVATPTPSISPFQALEISQVTVISQPAGSNTQSQLVDVVLPIKNLNPRSGVGNYPVEFIFENGAGEIIMTHQEDAYILPGSQQYIVALGIRLPPGEQLGRIEAITPTHANTDFVRLPDTLDPPRLSTSLQQRIQNDNQELQRGIVTNNSAFDWERTEVTAVGLDANRNIVATGKTFVGALKIGEQREFSLSWPIPHSAVQEVIAIASTNIFREDNVIRMIGNPESLR